MDIIMDNGSYIIIDIYLKYYILLKWYYIFSIYYCNWSLIIIINIILVFNKLRLQRRWSTYASNMQKNIK